MAFDQSTRNRLARFVGDARILLTEEFIRQLQNEYGLDPGSGTVTGLEKLTALDDTRRETARILRETMEYYLAGKKADAKSQQEVLQRIVREQAFSVLNRLCALRMAESRGILLESIARGQQSKGFQLYVRLAGSGLGESGDAYQSYLFSLFDEFAVDLAVLFDRFSPQGRLFPRQAVLIKLLDLINDPEIDQLWSEDETIGWIYQYFNTKEERKAMRDASQAPRNSRELAVRNQFFTPRYVVEFLTDNTLGRIWYEMTRGETSLKDSCHYLVRRKHPFFLKEAEEIPQPFDPRQTPLGDPDLAGEMWVRPDPELGDISDIFRYALTVGGYDYACQHFGKECAEIANLKLDLFHESGKWEGSFEELRCCLFFEQRRYHHFGQNPEGDAARPILALYQAICERWDLETEFIPHRPLKDPRELKMLDPACGSMHFGLYAFDLFEKIYAEAWDLEEKLGKEAFWHLADLDPLHDSYLNREAFFRDVPRLIIERNIHGIDIDPRAVQISGLSLWLRAQRSWQVLGLKLQDRPQIRKSNIVCAEPMPGDRAMLEEFLETLKEYRLEALMRRVLNIPDNQMVRATKAMADTLSNLVRTVWHEMELAGEAGSLLQIEETLRGAIAKARASSENKAPLFSVLDFGLEETIQHIENKNKIIDFWGQAEKLVLEALKEYAELTENSGTYKRRLFVGDAVRGFSFIDISQKRYDVSLMNPPFGLATNVVFEKLRVDSPETYVELYASFVRRLLNFTPTGLIGAISSRGFFTMTRLTQWRRKDFIDKVLLVYDLGLDVMDDAFVRSSAYILSGKSANSHILALDASRISQKHELGLAENWISVENIRSGILFVRNRTYFLNLPDSKFLYKVGDRIIKLFSGSQKFEGTGGEVRTGLTTFNDERFLRLLWEVPPLYIGQEKTWQPFSKGGEYAKYYTDIHLLINRADEGIELGEVNKILNGQVAQSRQGSSFYYRPGLTFTSRSGLGISIRALPAGCVISHNAPSIYPLDMITNRNCSAI